MNYTFKRDEFLLVEVVEYVSCLCGQQYCLLNNKQYKLPTYV